MFYHATGQNRFDRTFSFLWENLHNYNGSSHHPSSAAIRRASLAHGLRPAYPNKMNGLIAEARRMAPSLSRGTSVVHFLRLRSGIICIGSSTDLEQRFEDHVAGQACRTTLLDRPAAALRIEVFTTFAEARQREAQLKRWSRAKKEALIGGNFEALRKLGQSRD